MITVSKNYAHYQKNNKEFSETGILPEFQKKRGSLIRAPPFRTTRTFKPPLGYLKDVGVGLMDSGCSNSAEELPAVADPRIG